MQADADLLTSRLAGISTLDHFQRVDLRRLAGDDGFHAECDPYS